MNTAAQHNGFTTADAARYLASTPALHAALGFDGAACDVRAIGQGEHNRNFSFVNPANGIRYVLRVNVAPQPFHKNQVAYEHAALTALAPSKAAPLPYFIDDSADAPGKGVLVTSFCEGSELDFDHLRAGDLSCAVQLMANVHAVPVQPGCPLFRPVDPLTALFDECIERFEVYRASGFEDARITAWAERFIAAGKRALATPATAIDRTHIVNTETLPSHFLIPAQAAAAAAANAPGWCESCGSFIDWERPVIGEVAQDVAYFCSPTTTFWDSEFLFPESKVEGLVEAYWKAVDGRFAHGNFDVRFKAWRTMTILRSVTWCCRALKSYSATNRGSTHTTSKTARKLPVYVSDEFMELCYALVQP